MQAEDVRRLSSTDVHDQVGDIVADELTGEEVNHVSCMASSP
jgi:hypothetical protein